MKRLIILLFLGIVSFEIVFPAAAEKRYILWKYAAFRPIKSFINVEIIPGKIINVISTVYNEARQWIRFYYPGKGIMFIPEEYTLAVPQHGQKTITELEKFPDIVEISPVNNLPYHYKPAGLQYIPVFTLRNRKIMLRKRAAIDFFKMARDAELEGLNIIAYRGFTSAEEQANRYFSMLETYSRREFFPFAVDIPTADIMQTGLAVDISSSNVNYKCEFNFYFSKEYKWLVQNGSRYGFYPYGGSQDDFSYKPYRFRYFYRQKFARIKNQRPDFKEIDLYGTAKLIIKTNNSIRLTYFKVHDEETTAAHAIMYIYNRYGGRLIDLINTSDLNKRNFKIPINGKNYYIDPNRIFTEAGIKKMRKINHGLDETDFKIAERLVRKIREKILRVLRLNSKTPFLYVHTNHFDTILDIHYLARMSRNNNNVFDIYYNPIYHPKIFTYVIRKRDYDYLRHRGITVVLQKWTAGIDDGSMSIYVQNKIPLMTYATIESMNEDPMALIFIADITVQYFLKKNRW